MRISRIPGKQADDPIRQLRLLGDPILLRESVQRTGNELLDVSGERGMGLGGLQLGPDDAGTGRIEAEKSRLQAGRDQALIESEGEVVLVGIRQMPARLLEGGPCCHLSHR